MKRVFAFVVTMLLGACLSFAQAGGGTSGKPADDTSKSDTGKKAHKGGKKAHKGGKKSKKGASTDTTTPPPK